jgi:protein Tex
MKWIVAHSRALLLSHCVYQPTMSSLFAQLAQEIHIRLEQVQAAVGLLDGGATVPFIARYRKEVTGGLDDIQLRELEQRSDLPARIARSRAKAVLKSIAEQGKLTQNCKRPSRRLPPSRNWKTCTCPTNPNAAPKA